MVSIKGSQARAALELVGKKMGERAQQAVLDLLADADRQILTQPGLALRWVPMDTYARFLHAIVQVGYGGDERGLIAGTAKSVEGDLAGVYKAFTLLASPEEFIRRIVSINQAYLDGVTVETRRVAANSFVVSYHGFERQHRLMELALTGWLTKMISAAQGRKAKVELLHSVSDGKGEIALSVKWES